jgi:hypothetical protein
VPSGAWNTGPFKFTVKQCGALTPAQKSQFATNAPDGAILYVTNISSANTAKPVFHMELLRDSLVDGSNVSDAQPIAGGQSGYVEIDYGFSDAGRPGDTCDVTGYDVVPAGSITAMASYGDVDPS